MLGFDVTIHTPTGEKRVHLVASSEIVALKLAKRAFGDHPMSFVSARDRPAGTARKLH